jgi:DNA-binding CsgD family transcriptional regulator
MVDGGRRYLEVNRPARLLFRLSLDEMRTHVIDDFTPTHMTRVMEQAWRELLDTGSTSGHRQMAGPDGSRLDIVCYELAHVRPNVHLIAFAPAGWPEDELEAIPHNGAALQASLTPRELELMAFAADGLDGPELARELALSPATVNTHLKHIYAKLEVSNRAGAVAEAMRLGLVD